MTKPYTVTLSHYERVISEGQIEAGSIEHAKAKVRETIEAIKERPLQINIISSYHADKREYDETIY